MGKVIHAENRFGSNPGTIDDKVREPSLTEKAVTEIGKSLTYRDDISNYVRGLSGADPKDLEKQGILKGRKIDALALYEAVNKVSANLIRKHLGDTEDYSWRPEWEQFKAIVERFGGQGKVTYDLVEQLVALYITAAQNQAATRNVGRTRGAPLAEAKQHASEIAELVGKKDIYGGLIANAPDPTAVVQIKSQLEGDLRTKVGEKYAITGSYRVDKAA